MARNINCWPGLSSESQTAPYLTLIISAIVTATKGGLRHFLASCALDLPLPGGAETPPRDREIERQLDQWAAFVSARRELTWDVALTVRQAVYDIMVSKTISENDYLIVHARITAMLDTMRGMAEKDGSLDWFLQTRARSEATADYVHYVLKAVIAGPPENLMQWALTRKTADGRAVFPLIQKFRPEQAAKILAAVKAKDV